MVRTTVVKHLLEPLQIIHEHGPSTELYDLRIALTVGSKVRVNRPSE